MRTFLHGFLACGFGLVFCLASSAQSGFQYQSPAKWDNFHPERETLQRYVLAQVPDDLPHLICGRLFRANQPWKRFVRYPAVH